MQGMQRQRRRRRRRRRIWRRRRSWGQGQWLAGGGGGCSINTGAARLPVTNSCPSYPSVPGSFSQREVLASSYKLVHLFNSMLGSGDSIAIVFPICPKITSQTKIIGKLVILIKNPENCQHIILPQPSFTNPIALILPKIHPPRKHVCIKISCTNSGWHIACSFLKLTPGSKT